MRYEFERKPIFSKEAEWVLSVVCGYGAPRQWKQPIMISKLFVDDSIQGKWLVMSGFISTAKKWAEFSIEWQNILDQEGIKEFKMSARKQSALEINGFYYRCIENHVEAIYCAAMPIDRLKYHVSRMSLPKALADPYLYCSKMIINGLPQFQKDLGYDYPIEIIFDDQDQVEGAVNRAWDVYVKNLDDDDRNLTYGKPRWANSQIELPLQAADILAHWYCERLHNGGSFNDESSPFPWSVKKEIPRLLVQMDEKGLLENLKKFSDVYYSTGISQSGFITNF